MKELAALMLLKIAGKSGSAEEITAVLVAGGGEADEAAISTLLEDVGDKDLSELLATGMGKLKDVPMGGSGGGGGGGGGGSGGDAGAEEEKEEEKPVEEEMDLGGGMSMFGEEEGGGGDY
jgi:ribosomal protein L12E/L44/L45/RPP1/RPP2